MARIVVSGATGFLGGETARALVGAGHDVVGLGRRPEALAALERAGAAPYRIDLAQSEVMAAGVLGRADAFIHCAALSAPWGPELAFENANVAGTQKALDMAEALGVRRFVNISSPTIYYAPRDQEHVREDHKLPRPINAYAASKVAAEALVRFRPGLGPITLRPRGLYGLGDSALLPRLLDAAATGPLPMLRGGKAEIDLTHVSDAVGAILAALEAGQEAEGEAFNISGGAPMPVYRIVEAACAASGVTPRWRALPWRTLLGLARLVSAVQSRRPDAAEPRITPYTLGLFTFRQSLDIAKAGRLLGWRPAVSFDEGLRLTFPEAAA